jgi:hypothetical protein
VKIVFLELIRRPGGGPGEPSRGPRIPRHGASRPRRRDSWPAVLALVSLLTLAPGPSPAVSPPDTSAARRRTDLRPAPAAPNEIDLDSIEIQGRVEQPNVILIPARLDPALQDTSLDRSFKNEIRSGTGGIASPDTFMRRVEPPPSIRNSIKKKRK